MFGINGGEALVLLLVIAIVVGPERLPQYTEQLASGARAAKRLLTDARARVSEEAGDVDWASIDPRRYDPRRIVRDALLDGDDDGAAGGRGPGPATGQGSAPRPSSSATGPASGTRTASATLEPGAPPPFDDEAT